MLNDVYWFSQYANTNGFAWPGKVVMYAHWGRTGGAASTPMLRYMTGTSAITNLMNSILNDNSLVLSSQILSAISIEKPDITIKKGENDPFNSVNLGYTIFHELAHASHFAKVGSAFWLPYIQHIVANGGYGNRSDSGSGRIALSEAWADYVGENFGSQYYGLGTLRNGQTFAMRLENPGRGWIPYGLYHDNFDGFNPLEPWDNVNGISMNSMYNSLTADVDTPQRFRDKIRLGRASIVQSNINAIFVEYGWN